MNCDNCGDTFPLVNDGVDYGGYCCCGGHYCTQNCVAVGSLDQYESWADHYEEDGECYYSEWNVEEAKELAA